METALSTFAHICPTLRKLELHSSLPPTQALVGIHLAVPNLEQLSLRLRDCDTDSETAELQQGVDTLCGLLHLCTKLTTLELLLGPEDEGGGEATALIKCTRAVWDQLPPSLVNLHCEAELCSLLSLSSLMSRVESLTLREFPCFTLPQLLGYAPKLESLTIESRDEVPLMWHADTSPEQLACLKAHLLRGFQLSCASVSLSGETVESIRDMMAWLSPLQDTKRCSLDFFKTEHTMTRLDQFAHVCPQLTHLSIQDTSEWHGAVRPFTDEAFLSSFAGCECLQSLEIYFPFVHTHSGLMSLVGSLPSLQSMLVLQSKDVSINEVIASLKLEGRDVDITQIQNTSNVMLA